MLHALQRLDRWCGRWLISWRRAKRRNLGLFRGCAVGLPLSLLAWMAIIAFGVIVYRTVR
jgi:hypothetical protein